MKKIGIVMGSDSDLKVVEKAADTLREYGVPFEMQVLLPRIQLRMDSKIQDNTVLLAVFLWAAQQLGLYLFIALITLNIICL